MVAAIVATTVTAIGGIIGIANSGVFNPQPSPTPIVRGVPNVYDMASNQAVTMLKSAGYAPRAISVCSHSVAQGRVRQVLMDGGATDGTILVDTDGVTPIGSTLPTGAAVVVKVSTGIAC